jgi:hypothetical protein
VRRREASDPLASLPLIQGKDTDIRHNFQRSAVVWFPGKLDNLSS